ncbi:hypothetical protein A3A46_02755 [Candidatus Roizmanbacteria bacterium RIFCSPLOWO2_01_FULL_37_13]|uniref:Uncharacterized protein n=1 Tax=Candidatus Roizmanbacteria bacterium RIFCSPHIGHO2_02_FULL_38_11 TaxID=1802039 RepID=A0A1F7H2A4_9BACT|nr:MAG: hypothetical protein A3C25_00165 [Candidatus Roizmanbacteria bacterium RIFCSPHIGHO2_02_FULL_38_11]OGK35002.1 MAG: hypothetical protein A3F58_03015 [Candidatus Roizmanbacteria bacterium RIFCSPHIGHO2_12_FULL_37_9b]OGK43045.1 MAG: hypothetical protein A3A46_02755 [Candidatus Roizmanbacteria bacterium RIFCSPLOWO2_01_FULL_37_13]
MTNQINFFQTLKSIIVGLTIALFPLFFLPVTQDYFTSNKLYLLSIGAILLLLNSSVEIILTKKLFFYKHATSVLMFFFVLAIFLSILVSSPNRVQAVLNPNFGLLSILMLSILSFYILDREAIVARLLSLSSVILSLIVIFFFIRPSSFFSPIGSQIDLAAFLGFCLILQLSDRIWMKKLFNKITFAITLSGFIICLNSLISAGLPDFSSFRYSWYSAMELFKSSLNALFGAGVDNYSSLFTKIKDASYDQSAFWQISSFNVAQSAFLHIMTESGLFGLISFLLLFIFVAIKSIKRHKPAILIIIYLTTVFLLLPPSLPLFFIFYIALGLLNVEKSEGTNNENEAKAIFSLSRGLREAWGDSRVIKIALLNFPMITYSISLIIITIVAISSYFLGRSYLAEYHFKKSVDAYGKKNNIKEIYDNQRLAILTNPYIERFRISFSQTNLLIANNIATKTKTSLQDSEGGRSIVSPQDRQTMTQAIQAAIEEAKAVVKLNDQKAVNWENLALIYRNLINTAQGADTWTISSYQRAILLDPQNPKYRLDLGGIYFLLGKYDEANRFFEQAATLKPNWPNAHYNLAWTLYQQKDYPRAVLEMQTVTNLLDPKKDAADLVKAQKDLEEFKLKLSEESSLK